MRRKSRSRRRARNARRGRNPLLAYNRRRSRRGRRSGRNPSAGIAKSLTGGFQKDVLVDAGAIVAGGLANAFLSNKIAGMGFMPSALKSGWGNVALKIGTAGLLGGITRMVAPKYALKVTIGGVVEPLAGVASQTLGSVLHGLGLGDYLIQRQTEAARPLGGLPGGMGNVGDMSDYLIRRQVEDARAMGGLGNLAGVGDIGLGCGGEEGDF